VSRGRCWRTTVEPVEPVERFLAHLSDVERSPNTIKAYGHDLKDWFVFLTGRSLDWQAVRLDDVGEFVAWLRLPPAARAGRVVVLPSVASHCGEATVNRKLAAVSAFYQHAARNGVELGDLLTSWQPAGRRGTAWRPFLHHLSKSRPQQRREIRLKAQRKAPRVLAPAEVQSVLDGCVRLRDRLLLRCCTTPGCASVRRWGYGMRTGRRLSGRSRWCRGSTTTGPGRSRGSRARSR